MLPPTRPSILLVDDDRTLLSVLARRVSRAGFEVTSAISGPAALKSLESGWPGLLVVDLMMPGMDGFELCRRVKQIADLPIIVLSAVDASEAKVSALELYAEDYVTKPFDPDELVARAHRVLRRAAVGNPQISLDGVTLEQALNQIMTMNTLSYKVVNERSIFVFPDTAQKHNQYDAPLPLAAVVEEPR